MKISLSYYPFGLQQKGYNDVVTSNKNDFAEKFKFNRIEHEQALGLNLYEMAMRQYDPAIARWTSIDPVIHFDYSTYNAFDNNPVYWSDPSGADATNLINNAWNNTADNGKALYTNNNNGTFSGSNGKTISTALKADNTSEFSIFNAIPDVNGYNFSNGDPSSQNFIADTGVEDEIATQFMLEDRNSDLLKSLKDIQQLGTIASNSKDILKIIGSAEVSGLSFKDLVGAPQSMHENGLGGAPLIGGLFSGLSQDKESFDAFTANKNAWESVRRNGYAGLQSIDDFSNTNMVIIHTNAAVMSGFYEASRFGHVGADDQGGNYNWIHVGAQTGNNITIYYSIKNEGKFKD